VVLGASGRASVVCAEAARVQRATVEAAREQSRVRRVIV